MASKISVPIISKKTIALDTVEVTFGLKKRPFIYQAGQYIELKLPKLSYDDPRGNHRLFSLVSSPNNQDKISIAFRQTGSGFKKTLVELPLNSKIEIEGPFGFLTLPENPSISIVFLAGGIGITPFLSMIRFAREKKLTNQMTLLYGNRNKQSAAYIDELELTAKDSNYFSLKTTFNRFDPGFLKNSIKNPLDKLWFIAGPQVMVTEVENLLLSLDINSNHIFTEEFTGY